MFKSSTTKMMVLTLLIVVQSAFSSSLECTFSYDDLCVNIQPHARQFEKISVMRTRPGGEVNFYFWLRDQPERYLSQSELNELGYSRVSVLMDMSHMLSFETVASVPFCAIAKALKEGAWVNDQGKAAYQVISSIQAGVYYIQVNLVKSANNYVTMQRDNDSDASINNFEDYLMKYDADNEINLRLLPTSSTYYFGVAPQTNENRSVKLYLKP